MELTQLEGGGRVFPPEEYRPISWPPLLPPLSPEWNGLEPIFILVLMFAKPTYSGSKAERRTGFLTGQREGHSVITVLLFSTRQ